MDDMNISELTGKNSVLIVDDEVLNITALSQILSSEYTIYVAKEGKDAIETAKEIKPCVILLDVLMPGMSGFDVITTLKSTEETRDIPVIFLTGLNSPKDEEKGLALGAADYIYKPFTPAIVKLRIRNQVQILNQMRIIYQLSITDTLTNTYNRRYFNTRFSQEWQRALREKTTLSIFMLDVDHFKQYNDTHGHLQGDFILLCISGIVKEGLKRPADLLARWGGEEFAVMMPSTDMDGAYKTAEDIRLAVEKSVFPLDDNSPSKVTVSIGVNSTIPDVNSSINRFVAETDRALYRAKETGRNKTVTTRQL